MKERFMLENYDKWREELLPAFCIVSHGLNGDDDGNIYCPFQERFFKLIDEAEASGYDDKRVFQTLFRLFTGETDYGQFESCYSSTCDTGRKNPLLFLETFLEELPRMLAKNCEKGAATDWAIDFLKFAITLDEFSDAFGAATEEQKTLMRQLATDISPVFVKNQTGYSGPIVKENLSLIKDKTAN
jgi:hypothetical protein